jgi:(2Fe-2S) ferredoxin
MGANDTETPVEVLERWERHGAAWRAVHVSDAKAIVDLCTCGGEPVERIESDDPALIRLLRERPSTG